MNEKRVTYFFLCLLSIIYYYMCLSAKKFFTLSRFRLFLAIFFALFPYYFLIVGLLGRTQSQVQSPAPDGAGPGLGPRWLGPGCWLVVQKRHARGYVFWITPSLAHANFFSNHAPPPCELTNQDILVFLGHSLDDRTESAL